MRTYWRGCTGGMFTAFRVRSGKKAPASGVPTTAASIVCGRPAPVRRPGRTALPLNRMTACALLGPPPDGTAAPAFRDRRVPRCSTSASDQLPDLPGTEHHPGHHCRRARSRVGCDGVSEDAAAGRRRSPDGAVALGDTGGAVGVVVRARAADLCEVGKLLRRQIE